MQTEKEAIERQLELTQKIDIQDYNIDIKTIAGIDLAYHKTSEQGFCAIVLLEFPSLRQIAVYTATAKIEFPYIRNLLAFREAPLIKQTLKQVPEAPDLLVCDGQGIAHPRGIGIATQLGIELDIPSIGCAKSRLYGRYLRQPAEVKGSRSYLYNMDGDEIGVILRT